MLPEVQAEPVDIAVSGKKLMLQTQNDQTKPNGGTTPRDRPAHGKTRY